MNENKMGHKTHNTKKANKRCLPSLKGNTDLSPGKQLPIQVVNFKQVKVYKCTYTWERREHRLLWVIKIPRPGKQRHNEGQILKHKRCVG